MIRYQCGITKPQSLLDENVESPDNAIGGMAKVRALPLFHDVYQIHAIRLDSSRKEETEISQNFLHKQTSPDTGEELETFAAQSFTASKTKLQDLCYQQVCSS